MNPLEIIPPDLYPIIISAATSIGTTYLVNGEFGPTRALSDLWYSKFGNFHESITDKRYIRDLQRKNMQLEATAQIVAEEVVKIPEDKIHAPRETIARPSLSALEDYASEEHTREMFAKLLASSMDERKDLIAHQSFVDIIKNMSPLDAKLLVRLNQKSSAGIPIANIKSQSNTGSFFQTVFRNLIAPFDDFGDQFRLYSSSITNLARLGLVEVTFQNHMVGENAYDSLNQTSIFKKIESDIQTQKEMILKLPDDMPELARKTYLDRLDRRIELDKGILTISPLGIDFCEACL